MGNKEIKPADFVTIPNLLTYLRILLIAPFVISFIKEQYILAMAVSYTHLTLPTKA